MKVRDIYKVRVLKFSSRNNSDPNLWSFSLWDRMKDPKRLQKNAVVKYKNSEEKVYEGNVFFVTTNKLLSFSLTPYPFCDMDYLEKNAFIYRAVLRNRGLPILI